MPYLIDGHNLIPKAGLHLDSLDDEMELIGVLQEYSRLERKQVEVYFDGAPAPQAGTRKFGAVTAHFVLRGATADEAIRQRLKKLGKAARNWTVVTSDREVQAEARAFHAEVISSDSFAKSLRRTPSPGARLKPERNMSDNEVEEWLNLFEKRTKRS